MSRRAQPSRFHGSGALRHGAVGIPGCAFRAGTDTGTVAAPTRHKDHAVNIDDALIDVRLHRPSQEQPGVCPVCTARGVTGRPDEAVAWPCDQYQVSRKALVDAGILRPTPADDGLVPVAKLPWVRPDV
jgi:hypothetical protein